MPDYIRMIEELEAQRVHIDQAIAGLRAAVGQTTDAVGTLTGKASNGVHEKGGLTPAARKKIADAQHRRWAAKRAEAAKKQPKQQ